VKLTVDVPDAWVDRLRVLGPDHQHDDVAIADVVLDLLDHAQQGVYRPGAWERGWLQQAFGDAWEQRLEPDTDNRAGDGRIIFQRPRRA
jgi:hypothetical protein